MNNPPRYERSIEDTTQEKLLNRQIHLRREIDKLGAVIAKMEADMNKAIILKDVFIGFCLAFGLMALLWWWLS